MIPAPRRVVLAHGFTQTARSWSALERILLERLPGIETIAVDMPGHGDAVAAADADLWASARHLVEHGRTGTYVGYSMGGRVALHAALAHPDRVRALVLIATTAGIDDPTERARRRAADDALAARIERIGVDAFLDEWLANPLFAGLPVEAAGRDDRLRNQASGLAASLRAAGTGTQAPLWDRLGEIDMPTLIIVGAHDEKFTALGERLHSGIAGSHLVVIPDAGHSVVLEQPDATADAIATWLAER